jgi:sialidase-1
VIYSDDHGQSWQRGEMVPNVVPNLNETTIVERTDGSVLLNMRNGIGVTRRVITASPDGIGNWATPWLDPVLVEPTCQGTLFRYSSTNEGRSRILFCNPNCLAGKDAKGSSIFRKRQNLTVKLRHDEGQTWPVSKVIESGLSGYSALAVCADKTIFALFERGASDSQNTDDYLSLARFNLAWLSDGQDDGL